MDKLEQPGIKTFIVIWWPTRPHGTNRDAKLSLHRHSIKMQQKKLSDNNNNNMKC